MSEQEHRVKMIRGTVRYLEMAEEVIREAARLGVTVPHEKLLEVATLVCLNESLEYIGIGIHSRE